MEEADSSYLLVGDYMSSIKGMWGNLVYAIAKSFPKNHAVAQRMWRVHDRLMLRVCSVLDSDICNHYPMAVHSIGDRPLTSIFYRTEQMTDIFKDKPSETRCKYTKQVSQEEIEYLERICHKVYIVNDLVNDHRELFTYKSRDAMLALYINIKKLETYLRIVPA